MTGHAKKLLSALLLLSLPLLVTACGSDDDTPTSPSTTTPTILSLSPSSPSASATTFSMNVTGTNFVSGLSLILKSPNAGATEFGGSAITNVTATSFTAAVNTPAAGNWTATVKNPDGTSSAEFGFTVQGATSSGAATITSVAGGSALLASQTKQAVFVQGTNFTSGMMLTLVAPNGISSTISGSDISAQTATSFTAAMTLSSAGSWQLTVRNNTNVDSAIFSFTVGGGTTGTLAVTGVSPNPITASANSQTFGVSGTGFLAGLRFVLNGPDTGATSYSGADVQSVTATGFTANGRVTTSGNWSITVYNPDGAASNIYSFQAVSVIAETLAHAFGFQAPPAAVVGH